MSHVRRLSLGAVFIMAALILGLILDTAVYDIYQFVEPQVQSGPFAALPDHVLGVAQLVVPVMLLGTIVWIIWGSIKEERREEQRRRVRRGP